MLPAVVKASYKGKPEVLADILAPLVDGLEGKPAEAIKAAKGVEKWLASVGIDQKLKDEGFAEKDIDKLVKLAFETPSLDGLLACAPVDTDKETVRQIFADSFDELN